MKSKGVSGTSGTLAQEVVNGYAEKHRGLTTDLLPTPNTYDYNTTQDEESKQRTLKRRAEEGKTCFPSRFNALRQLAREGLLPTPIASDFMEGTAAIRKDTGEQRMDSLKHMMATLTIPLDKNGKPDKSAAPDGGTSRLSPLFTEEMMGFPYRHTMMPFSKQEIIWIEIV